MTSSFHTLTRARLFRDLQKYHKEWLRMNCGYELILVSRKPKEINANGSFVLRLLGFRFHLALDEAIFYMRKKYDKNSFS